MKKRHRAPISAPNNQTVEMTVQLRRARQELEQAEGQRLARNFDQAEKICISLLRKHPDYYGAVYTLGLVFADKGDHRKSIQFLNRAAILLPESWTTLIALAGGYLFLESIDLALKTALEAYDLAPDQAVVHVTLGEIYIRQRDYRQARVSFARAIELDGSYIEASLGYIRTSLELGEFEGAALELNKVFQIQPNRVDLIRQYFNLPDEFSDAAKKSRIIELVLDGAVLKDEPEVARLFFQTAAFERLGKTEEAWNCAVRANKAAVKDHKQEILAELSDVKVRADWLAKNRGAINTRSLVDKDLPTTLFVFGPSRSGKTTLEGLLGKSADVKRGYENPIIQQTIKRAYHESGFFPLKTLSYLPPQFYPNVTKIYKEKIQSFGVENKVITNTTPGYLWDAPFFHSVVPNARYVFIKRNIYDLMWRIFTKNYRTGNWYSYSLPDLKAYIKRYYDIIDLMADWMPQSVSVIQYEDLVKDPSKHCSEVLELCGISSDKTDFGTVRGDIGCSEPYRELIDKCLGEFSQVST